MTKGGRRGGGGAAGSSPRPGEAASVSSPSTSASPAPASPAKDDKASSSDDPALSRDQTYFAYYGQLTNQQNMLQDNVRTGAYQFAIATNPYDFQDKVVLDVGAGSGILSFFAAFAGAKHVYAVEASSIAEMAKKLVASNNLSDRITVLRGKLEEITLPEKVDVIVSEPMGVLLVHERMIETFVRARLNWLKPGGRMFPSSSTIMLAPFTDAGMYSETISKARFWQQPEFYGVDLTSLQVEAMEHHFGQPVVGCFDPRILVAPPTEHLIDFSTVSMAELERFTIPFRHVCNFTGIVHGIAGWFDVKFTGTSTESVLSTSPMAPKTHWYQIRFLFKNPIGMNAGQALAGTLSLVANDQRSYDVTIDCELEGATLANGEHLKVHQTYLLHEQQYWYPTLPDPNIPVPPETHNLYARQ